ncbi:MAG: arginine--tRNA ligase, partial [Chloroflexota bacterium]
MFDSDLAVVGNKITAILSGLGIADAGEIKWQPTPFAGQWGMGTNICFQAAAVEARTAGGKKVNVPARAQELAQLVTGELGTPEGFARVVADKAFVNFYFDTATYAGRVVEAVIARGNDFGRGAPKGERVMVEFSQPNTHKAFHVGHLRNVILGAAMSNVLEFAGFDTVRANYMRLLLQVLNHFGFLHGGAEAISAQQDAAQVLMQILRLVMPNHHTLVTR